MADRWEDLPEEDRREVIAYVRDDDADTAGGYWSKVHEAAGRYLEEAPREMAALRAERDELKAILDEAGLYAKDMEPYQIARVVNAARRADMEALREGCDALRARVAELEGMRRPEAVLVAGMLVCNAPDPEHPRCGEPWPCTLHGVTELRMSVERGTWLVSELSNMASEWRRLSDAHYNACLAAIGVFDVGGEVIGPRNRISITRAYYRYVATDHRLARLRAAAVDTLRAQLLEALIQDVAAGRYDDETPIQEQEREILHDAQKLGASAEMVRNIKAVLQEKGKP